MHTRLLHVVGTGLLLVSGCVAPSDGDDDVATSADALTPAAPFYGDPANGAVFAVDISMWEGPMAQPEMDCFWTSGVRHVVVGTQVEEIARQQLAMAVARGMTVDAYVYVYWDRDMRAQVAEAFRRTADFPIRRMWLDVEENPRGLGYRTLVPRIQDGIDECRTHAGVDCGIYTGPGFWKTYMGNTTALADVPLWYAQYNYRTSLGSWATERFGGWQKPVAKQWAEQALCNVGVDKDTMQPLGEPAVTVDRTTPPDTGLPPPAPTGLYPADGSAIGIDQVKLMVSTIPRATRYELAVEKWNGRAFVPYYTWPTVDGFRKTFPVPASLYRFRARAQNVHGWGPWSAWSTYTYGKYTGPLPP